MSDQSNQDRGPLDGAGSFEDLIAAAAPAGASFATAFRGYDKDAVDSAIEDLTERLRAQSERVSSLEEQVRSAQADVEERVRTAIADADTAGRDATARLEADLAAAEARANSAEQQVQALTEELMGAEGESTNRHHFEEVLRVAEEQASLLIKNATVQGDRLLESAKAEIQNRRKDAQAEADGIIAQGQHAAQQARLKIETELTAHEARLEREAAHAAEKVSQAEQEAATIRSEAEKGAAALRSMVSKETEHMRAEAEDAVRELRMRALDFEESLTRRQDDAQQEFLVLHNQAVAHAERITQDANEQVSASLEHSQRVSAKAEDFDRLMRAQAAQLEADATVRSREILERAQIKAQKIIDTVSTHSQAVLRDAEDRTRQLRWQQHQLTSFMAEVRELIRPESSFSLEEDGDATDVAEDILDEDLDGADEFDDDEVIDAAGDDDEDDEFDDEDEDEADDDADEADDADEDDEVEVEERVSAS